MADPHQLEMAVLNLAVNARDAMPEGGLIIIAARAETVSVDSDSLKAGLYVCLSLIDSGEGMDEATLARAMEPFFTTKGVGKGTGLGLSMVHGMAEQSGGRFLLKSRKGEGTTAEIWLPLATAAPATGAHSARDEPVYRTRPLVVLAVDDDSLVLMNTVMMLEELGHTVFEAHSAKEALEIVRREKTVELIVTDHAMPRMTGTQLSDALRAEHSDIPVILATGYAELPADEPSTLPRLSKPFTQDNLAKAIAETIGKA